MGGTNGRALHLLDVDYLGLGPTVSAGDLALTRHPGAAMRRRAYRPGDTISAVEPGRSGRRTVRS